MKRKLVTLLSAFLLATSLNHVLNGQTPDNSRASEPEAVLASQLIAAKTEEERIEMLRANTLVNLTLLKSLADEASRLEGKAPMQEVERVNSIRLSVAESLGNKPEILEALLSLGNSMRGASKVETYKRGLALSEEYQDLRMTSRFVMAIGGEHPGLDGRLEYYVRALQIAEDINDLKLQGNILGRIGNINTQKGDYIAARSYHTRALEIRERVKDLDGQSITHSNLGILEQHQGDLDAAISHFAKAIEISEGLGNKFGIAIDSYNLGNAYLTRRDFTRAMKLYARSLDVSEELKCRGCAIGASINVANLYVEQGNAEQARFYIRKAVDTDDEQQYPAYALGTLADSYRIEGKLQEAIRVYERLLLLKEKENANADYLAETLVQIGRSYLALSDPEMAERSFKRALALRNPAGGSEWAFHSTLGLAQAELIRKRYDTALQYALDAQALRSDPADGSGSWELSATAGRAYKGLGRFDEARQQFEKAIGSIESSLAEVVGDQNEKQKYFGDRADVYYEMIDLLLSAGKVQEAMEYVERVKARALVTTIQNGKVDISRGLSDSERAAERRLLNELFSLHARIGKAKASDAPDVKLLSDLSIQTSKKRLEFEGFRNQLYARHPETKMYRGSLQTRLSDNTRLGFVGPETVVIEYSVSKDKVTGFIVEAGRQKPTSLKVFVADTNEVQLRSAIRSVTKQFAEGSLEFRAGARQLYDLLLKPAAAQLAGKSNLIIVPDGPLWDLPFQALMDEKGKYLAEKMAVSYAPSLTALREMQKKAKSRKPSPQAELLAFGNPIVAKETSEKVQRVFMSEKLEPIPEAERLVNELGRMYGPERSKIFTGSNAREETAKTEAPKYRIVQFATHGILNNASPMYSHLVLAQNDKNPNEDGLLEAWELKDLDLKADMVILSACDTARGRISAGEGIIGMTWASFIAGAPTTVASQWKVESRSTTELMLEFHRQLLKGNVSKAEALRRAQLKLLRDPKYRHPSYWAAWVIVGDGS